MLLCLVTLFNTLGGNAVLNVPVQFRVCRLNMLFAFMMFKESNQIAQLLAFITITRIKSQINRELKLGIISEFTSSIIEDKSIVNQLLNLPTE